MDKIKELFSRMNALGVPLPFLRDPKSGTGSISLTMMVISFIIVITGIVGKWSKMFDVDVAQALNLLTVTSTLYFGRTVTQSITTKKDSNET